MGDTNELKPCPFCGGKGNASERTCDKDSRYNPNDRAYPVVRCSVCFTTVGGKDWSGISTAIEAWNKRATATPPAAAALADLIAHMEHGAKLVDAIGALCRDGSPERNAADAIRKAAAALRARAVPEGKKYHDVAQRLYALLDDIDTAGDIAKSDDKLYRGIVERTQAKKRDFVVSCDGYTVTLADDSMLTASKEDV